MILKILIVCATDVVCIRDGMIHRCIAVSQYDTGIDTTFNVSIYHAYMYRNNRMY